MICLENQMAHIVITLHTCSTIDRLQLTRMKYYSFGSVQV